MQKLCVLLENAMLGLVVGEQWERGLCVKCCWKSYNVPLKLQNVAEKNEGTFTKGHYTQTNSNLLSLFLAVEFFQL